MSRQNVVMPQMGESITNGTITKWHKQPGDKIEIDEVLLEISTDKVESEIPSPVEGRIEVLHYNEGDTVDIGIVIAEIEEEPDSVAFGGAGDAKPAAPKAETPAEQPAAAPVETPAAPVASVESTDSGERRFYTPLVKAMAADHGIALSELSNISGSGAAGRVNKADLLNYIESKKGGAKAAATKTTSAPPAATSTPASNSDRVEIIPMDNMRKAIAKNMVQSKLTSPHVNSVDEVDMTHLVKYRESVKHDFKAREGFSLTYTHFIMYAMIHALKEHPMVNASVDGDNIVVKKDINLGCAVAVPGNGLVVPIVKNADGLNVTGLARRVNELAHMARNKKLTLDELQGGTFTFTNVGSFGTLFATPVILQPQVGIMAAGVIKKRPMIIADDAIAVRSMMYLTHTYDHRLVDGELGGRFLATVKKNLEEMDPASLF